MDYTFSYETVATGDGIVGRSEQIHHFMEAFDKDNRHIAMYGAPRSGKETVILEALERLRRGGRKFHVCEIDLFNVRSYPELASTFRSSMQQCFREVNKGLMLPFDIDITAIPDSKLFDLPEIMAEEANCQIVIYFKEFQNILSCEGEELPLDKLDRQWAKQKRVKYILTGSFVNMMKSMMEERKLFYYTSILVELPRLDRRKVCDFITSSFLKLGRVIEAEEAMEICDIASCDMWYVKQMCSTCYSQPAGYINRKVVNHAARTLISVHAPRFKQIMNDLTVNQINFIKALIDGVDKFSSADILDRYRLNSSANVFRIKDALKKKEVVEFDRDDNARILDPLFEYWLRNIYF